MRAMRCWHRLLLAILLSLIPWGARAAGIDELLAQLGTGDFDQKVHAVRELGTLGDPRAIAILKALNDGTLYSTADHKVVIAEESGRGFKLFDPLDHKPLGEA